MKKRYLLLFCLSFLCSHKIWADVGSIQIRLNENMQVVDLATSSVSTPTIDEVFVQQGGLTTAEENQCTFNQDGTVQTEGCICPGEGVLTPHGNTFVCCDEVNKKIYKGGAYSSYFMPTCGCPAGYSVPWSSVSTEKLCCKNGQSCYTELGGTEICENSDACGCPDGSKEYKGYCCDGDGRVLTTTETGVQNYTLCGCAIDNPDTRKDYCDADKCAKTQGMKWCEAGVCIAEGEECPCIPGNDDNACSEDACPTQGGCWIDGSCAKKEEEKTCAQQACEAGGQKWCGETEKCEECPCDPNDENNSCTQDTCAEKNGCWDGTTCKAVDKESCSADQPWDENICACAEACLEGTQRIEEYCIPCPTGGEVKGEAGDYVCCDGDKKWYTEGAWSERPNYEKCGCPEGQYLEGNQCFSCTNDTHCSAAGQVCDIDKHTCVECINNDDCSDGKVCNAEKKCDCPTGEHWNESTSSCVECDGNYGTAATWPCSTNSEPLCSNGVCIACTTANLAKPYWYNGQCVECTENDPCSDGVCQTETNTCVECLTNTDCLNNPNNKYCVNKQCVQCTENDHCTQGSCEGNRCVVCHENKDCEGDKVCNTTTNTCACPADKPVWNGSSCVTCATVDPTKPFWDDENDVCVAGCNTTMKQTGNTCQCDKDPTSKTPIWDAWRNRCVSCFRSNDKTPVWNGTDCVECEYIPGTENTDNPRRKVWDLYSEKCVPCYDSISSNWTDLGCGSKPYHSDYDPRQSIWSTTGKPIAERVCKVETNTDNNRCVQCTEHSHCHGDTQKCNTQYKCVQCIEDIDCPTNQKCNAQNKCVQCTEDSDCSGDTPKCSNGVCKTCAEADPRTPNWDTTKKECVACSKHYTEQTGTGYECPSDKPYCDRDVDRKCKTCDNKEAKTDVGETAGHVKTLFGISPSDSSKRGCYLCKNDKTDNSTDLGCTSDYPICPTGRNVYYNVCCPKDKPKWYWEDRDNKEGHCDSCENINKNKPVWNEEKGICEACSASTPIWKNGRCMSCRDIDSKKPYWDTTKKQCYQCTEDDHCGGGQYCLNNQCTNCDERRQCGCQYGAKGDGTCLSDKHKGTRVALCENGNLNAMWKKYDDYECNSGKKLCVNHSSVGYSCYEYGSFTTNPPKPGQDRAPK